MRDLTSIAQAHIVLEAHRNAVPIAQEIALCALALGKTIPQTTTTKLLKLLDEIADMFPFDSPRGVSARALYNQVVGSQFVSEGSYKPEGVHTPLVDHAL